MYSLLMFVPMLYWPLFFGACIAVVMLFVKQAQPRLMLAGGLGLKLLSALTGSVSWFLMSRGLLGLSYDHPLYRLSHLGLSVIDLAGYGLLLWAFMTIRPHGASIKTGG